MNAVNTFLSTHLPFGHYRSAGFIALVGALLTSLACAFALWARCRHPPRPALRRRRDRVRLLLWPSVVRSRATATAAVALLDGLAQALAADGVACSVRVHVVAVLGVGDEENPNKGAEEATAVSEVAARAGLPVVLVRVAQGGKGIPDGAWLETYEANSQDAVAAAVDGVVCTDADERLQRAPWNRHKKWHI